MDEMKYVVERWRVNYNHYRPHNSLGHVTPAGVGGLCREAGCIRPQTHCLMEYRILEFIHRRWTKRGKQTVARRQLRERMWKGS